jgi:hypothetical protein
MAQQDDRDPPAGSGESPSAGRGDAERAAREARLAAALRENLKRRKMQARGRRTAELDAPVDDAGDGGNRG